MSELKVQGAAQPPVAAEAGDGAWAQGLMAQLEGARGQSGWSRAAVIELSTVALLSDASPGMPLRTLPQEVAQQILDARAAAMKEFFTSWAESMRKNARKDKKAALKRFLEQARSAAVERAADELRRSAAASPASVIAAAPRAVEPAKPSSGRPGPLAEPGPAGFALRPLRR